MENCFEVRRPSGDAVCSDKQCPCPEVKIPRGTGYLYVSQELVELRKDARSSDEIRKKLEHQRMVLALQTGRDVYMSTESANPILMCEQGARLRGLDLDVAAAEAKFWWETGFVHLSATPLAPKVALRTEKLYGFDPDEIIKNVKEHPNGKLHNAFISRKPEKVVLHQSGFASKGQTIEEAIKTLWEMVPAGIVNVGQPEIFQEGGTGSFKISAPTEEYAFNQIRSQVASGAQRSIQCLVPPKKGFLGLGKKPGLWEVQFEKEFMVNLSFYWPAEVTFNYYC